MTVKESDKTNDLLSKPWGPIPNLAETRGEFFAWQKQWHLNLRKFFIPRLIQDGL